MEGAAERKRIDNLDLMKTLAIATVIMLHVSLWDTDFIDFPTRGRIIQYAFRMISEGVPIFLFVNGFLLFGKKEPDLKKHYLKVVKLIVLTVVWGSALTLIGMKAGAAEPLTVKNVLHNVLMIQAGSPYVGFLWFLQNLAGVYLIFPMLKVLYDRSFALFRILFFIVGFFSVGVNVLQVIGEIIGNAEILNVIQEFLFFVSKYNPIGNEWYLFYFMLGAMTLHYDTKIQEHRWLLVGSGLIAWMVNIAVSLYLSKKTMTVYDGALFYRTNFFVFVLALYAITMSYQNHGKIINKFIGCVGRNTMGMYLVHTLVKNVIELLWSPGTFIGKAVFAGATFALSLLCGQFLKIIW